METNNKSEGILSENVDSDIVDVVSDDEVAVDDIVSSEDVIPETEEDTVNVKIEEVEVIGSGGIENEGDINEEVVVEVISGDEELTEEAVVPNIKGNDQNKKSGKTKKKKTTSTKSSKKKKSVGKETDDNAVINRKKGMKLTGKILTIVSAIIASIILTIVIISTFVIKSTSEGFVNNWLHSTSYAVSSYYNSLSAADYSVSDQGVLKKGSINLTDKYDFIDSLKEDLGVYSVLFYGNKAYLSSIEDDNGDRYFDVEITPEINNTLAVDDDIFIKNYTINNEKYYGYFTPLRQQTTGRVVGILFVGVKNQVVTSQIIKSEALLIGAILLITFIGILVLIYLLKGIIKAIGRTVRNVERVSNGELNFRVTKASRARSDEVGEIARAIQGTIGNLKGIVIKITNASAALNDFTGTFTESFDHIANTIDNVNVAVDEIANGATSQAGETQNANNEVLNMGNAIVQATGNVDVLDSSSTKMKTYSDEARSTLRELVDISEKTKTSVDIVQNQTNLTNDSAKQIQAATDLIADIASQTNLLSLNASIEAARAGEHGRGFAVVANEIRNLADQSRVSAEKIGAIVNKLISNSNESVETMNDVIQVIAVQNNKLEDTRKMFKSLNEEINEVNEAIGGIKNEMINLNSLKEIVLESVETLASIAEENAASTEETSASMVELTNIIDQCKNQTAELVELSTVLEESISVFKIK